MPKSSKAIADQFALTAEKQRRQRQAEEARAQAQAAAHQKAEAEAVRAYTEQRARKMKKAFAGYKKDIAPLVEALRSLPPDKDGQEFFVRADTHINDRFSNRPETRLISLWLVYSQAAPDSMKISGCETHGLYMPKKPHMLTAGQAVQAAWPYSSIRGEKEEQQNILISDRPILQINFTHTDGKEPEIKSCRYVEKYYRAYDLKKPGEYRGSYASSRLESDRRTHKDIKEFVPLIAAWVADVAPERIQEVRSALEKQAAAEKASRLQDNVAVLRPPTVRRRPKP